MKTNSKSILFLCFILLSISLISLYNGCKLQEGNDGTKYIKKYMHDNDKQLKKTIKNLSSTDDVSGAMSQIKQLTSVDTALNAALKSDGGGDGSWGWGDDDDDSSSSSSGSDSDSDSDSDW
tara:strand:- start:1110 stop:1472 length:363 start_codon:yes stop_codon:yes gene_type:complete